jgi:hypothetical protein
MVWRDTVMGVDEEVVSTVSADSLTSMRSETPAISSGKWRSGAESACDGEIGDGFAEAAVSDPDGVVSGGDRVHLEFAVVVGDRFAFPVGLLGFEEEMRAGDGAVLDVVYDAANRAENSGDG